MSRISHWLAPVVLGAAAAGASLFATPVQAQSNTDLIRVLVNASDVLFRSGQPYDRHNSNDGYNDRLVVGRDRYGRPVYYRNAPRYGSGYGNGYSTGYGNGYAYGNRYQSQPQQTRCDSRGRCTTRYYDPRYNRAGAYGQYDNRSYDRHDNRYGGGDDNRYNSGYDNRGWSSRDRDDHHDDD